MTKILRTLLALVLLLSLVPHEAGHAADVWVCPPCAQPCDDREHTAAGTCPDCGMPLRRKGDPGTQVVILLFDGVQIIDFTAPFEVFGQAASHGFRVTTAAREARPLTTAMGLSVTAAHTLAAAPRADVLVIPGGSIDTALDEATLAWVRTQAAGATHVLSVCNGAFILARAGLLDGLKATTFYGLLDQLKQEATQTTVVSDARFVDNGTVITTAGLSSGVEGSLHVIERMRGRGIAQQIALHMEYDWRPDGDFARAALADRHLPPLTPPGSAVLTLQATAGDRKRWERRYRLEGAGAAAVTADWVRQLEAAGWKVAPAVAGAGERGFVFEVSPGQSWTGRLRVSDAGGGAEAALSIAAR